VWRREVDELLQQRIVFEAQLGEMRRHLSTSLLDTYTPVWEQQEEQQEPPSQRRDRERDELVNVASPTSSESEDSYVHSPGMTMQRQQAARPSPPRLVSALMSGKEPESFKRHRYAQLHAASASPSRQESSIGHSVQLAAAQSMPSLRHLGSLGLGLGQTAAAAAVAARSASEDSPGTVSLLSLSGSELTNVDKEYEDARSTIRSLSQRLQSRYAGV
jgi:hypothetical protein